MIMFDEIRNIWNALSNDWKLVLFTNSFGNCLHLFENRIENDKINKLKLRDTGNLSWRGGSDYDDIYFKLTDTEIYILFNIPHLHLGDGDYILTEPGPINYMHNLRILDLMYHEINLTKIQNESIHEISFVYPYFNKAILLKYHDDNPNVILKLW